MCSELECGVCYVTYNAGRRCPRELHCKHSFCESCLLQLLVRPGGEPRADAGAIVCPLCRETTSISGGRKIRAELRVDEAVLEQLVAAGLLEDDGDEEVDVEEVETRLEAPAEDSDSPPATRGGAVRRSVKKGWKKFVKSNAIRAIQLFVLPGRPESYVCMAAMMI